MPRNADPPVSNGGAIESPYADQVRAQLERVLGSSLFRSSRRCQSLLRHVTEHALIGETASLKERTLGTDVFHRSPDYDTNQDPVVRTTAGEIRKKLAQYYQQPEHESELRIALPSGSYIPEFQHSPEAAEKASIAKAAPGKRRRPVTLAVMAVSALAIIALAITLAHPRSDLDRFWKPILDAPGGILVCIGQPNVYSLRSDALQSQIDQALLHNPGHAAPPASLPQSIPIGQLVPMSNRYVALGDAITLNRLTAIFERHGKPYHVRGGASTSFSDLRDQAVLLVGAFDNEWTLHAVGQLRYTFEKSYSGATETEMVRDRDRPANTDWKLVNDWPDWNISNDYAIVSRVLDQTTGRQMVVAAGITQYGTMGAGEFLSDPEQMAEAARNFAAGWQQKNLQVVLEVPVVHGVAGHPRVLATYVW